MIVTRSDIQSFKRFVPKLALAGAAVLILSAFAPSSDAAVFTAREGDAPLEFTLPAHETTMVAIPADPIASAVYDRHLIDVQTDAASGMLYVLPKMEGSAMVYVTCRSGETAPLHLTFTADAEPRTIILEKSVRRAEQANAPVRVPAAPLRAEGFPAEMKRLFGEQFVLLNEAFQTTFRELFGGGQAALELEDASDILNCGIEIRVQPPGKALKVLSLLSGGEKAFVAGADIAAMSTMTVKEGREFGKFGNDIFRRLETLPIPTIAAVNGFALGGGNELAMSCDIRYCSDNAVFGQPEVGLGITPGFGGTQRLVRVVGTGKAKEMVFTGQNIKADEAYRIGLVNGVYPREELMPAVMKLAQKIASNAPIAVRNSKRAVTDGFLSDLDHAIAIEEQYFSECFETEDQREGMKAFLEKRKVEKFNNR